MMTVRRWISLVLAGSIAGTGAATAAMPTPDYVAASTAGDLFERKAGETMLYSRDDRLRNYARMMIADHRKSEGLVKAAALQAGIAPTKPMLTAQQVYMLKSLDHAQGSQRDMLYITQQRAMHRATLAMQQDYALTGESPDLRDAAARIALAARQHLRLIEATPPL